MHAIAFAPLVSLIFLFTLLALSAALVAYAAAVGSRGAVARALALAALALVLANPLLVRERREPLRDVATILIDRTQSMRMGERQGDAETAARAIAAKLAAMGDLDVRTVAVESGGKDDDAGTQAFAALDSALADVPPSRRAGAILITDGEVHDAPAKPQLDAPFNALIVGRKDETDRKLTIVDAARYAIVGGKARLVVRIDDLGGANAGAARVAWRLDGRDAGAQVLALGRNADIDVPVAHEGESVIEIEAEPGPHELSLQNNRAVATVNGVRDRLRVLLISGEPNAGERVWRAFLKGDPSVDLVHFTILRPPEKQMTDETPLNELSLIVFPTQELFVDKLNGFDLIIFDRFSEHGILPLGYFQNVANYVENGGALLISAGPEFAGDLSVYRTPLAGVLPARPTGEIIARPFKPMLTEAGLAHPVTRTLPGANTAKTPPTWGRWFRQIAARPVSGETVMSANGKPLLVLDRAGKGRVAELLSDQGWLWSRGFEGGGPESELLRRTAHWLMKEPELEEEALHARIDGGDIAIERRSMAKTAPPLTLIDPAGRKTDLTLQPAEPGIWRASAKAEGLGLYRVQSGALSAVAAAGPLNPKEASDMRATDAILKPAAEASGGRVLWLADGIPGIARVTEGRSGGLGEFSLRENRTYRVTGVDQTPLMPPWLALFLIVGTLAYAWYKEGR
jgi:hypothetical protein